MKHKWIYRNPASRECKDCGEHQVLMATIFEDDFGNEYIAHEEWDIVYPLAHSPELCETFFERYYPIARMFFIPRKNSIKKNIQ